MNAKLLLCSPVAALALAVSVSLSAPSEAVAPVATRSSFEVDGGHSSVVYWARHMGVADFYGTFNAVSGEIVEAEDAEDCSVRIVIQADSIDSRSSNRDAHLTSPDFFSAEEFPEISFQSTSVEAGEEDDTYEVTGDLSVRGVTKEITTTVTKTGEAETRMGHKAGFKCEFTFDMVEFRMPAMSSMPEEALGRTAQVIVSLECNKQ